jgi:hypothetical protein
MIKMRMRKERQVNRWWRQWKRWWFSWGHPVVKQEFHIFDFKDHRKIPDFVAATKKLTSNTRIHLHQTFLQSEPPKEKRG